MKTTRATVKDTWRAIMTTTSARGTRRDEYRHNHRAPETAQRCADRGTARATLCPHSSAITVSFTIEKVPS